MLPFFFILTKLFLCGNIYPLYGKKMGQVEDCFFRFIDMLSTCFNLNRKDNFIILASLGCDSLYIPVTIQDAGFNGN